MTKKQYGVISSLEKGTASLYVSWKKGAIATTNINVELGLKSPLNREIIEKMMSENAIIGLSLDVKDIDSKTQMIWGEAIVRQERVNRRGPYKKKSENNESGFSLLELVVSMAIMIVLATMAFTTLMPLHDKIIGQIEDVKSMQQSNPDVQYMIEFNN